MVASTPDNHLPPMSTGQVGELFEPPSEELPPLAGGALGRSRWQAFIRHPMWRSRKMCLGLGIVGFFVVMTLFGPFIWRQDPTAMSASGILLPPSLAHPLGTTQTGQDVLAQTIIGARVSLLVGLVTGTVATVLSIVVGIAAGYFGGWVDDVLTLVINVFLVLPALPLLIVLAGYLPAKGPLPVALIISVTGWAWGARTLRAQTFSMRHRDFIEAARMTGERAHRVILFEILPNELAIVASGFIFTVIYAVLSEAGLAFLGLSDVSIVSWGTMLYFAQNNEALLVGAWWWFVPPGGCLAAIGAGLALINFGIDELTNPRLRTSRATRGKAAERAGATVSVPEPAASSLS